MRIVRLHGCYGINNLGDDYLLMSELSLLDKLNKSDLHILLDSENGYNAVKEIVLNFPNLNISVYAPQQQRGRLEKIKIWSNVDYYIVGGGGLFPSDRVETYNALLKQIRLYKFFGAKTAILGVDICRIKTKRSRAVWRKIINHLSFACFRNKFSYDVVKKIGGGGQKKLSYAPDLTFSFATQYESDDLKLQSIENELGIYGKKYIIWACANPWSDDELKDFHFQKRYDKLQGQIANLCNKYSNQGYLNVFLPFYHQGDMQFILNLKKRLTATPVICSEEMEIGAKRAIYKHATACISMRFHGTAFSLYHGVPVAAISYAPKTSEMMRENDLWDYCCEFGIRDTQTFFKEFDIDNDELTRICSRAVDCTEKAKFEEVSNRLKRESEKYSILLESFLREVQ